MKFKYSLLTRQGNISKEIWQIVIWSENLFQRYLMLQFSRLDEFRWGKMRDEHLTNSST